MNNNTKGLYHTEEVQMMELLSSLMLEPHGFGLSVKSENPEQVTFQSAVKQVAANSDLFSKLVRGLMEAQNTRQEKCISAKTHAERNEAVMDFASECETIILSMDILLDMAKADLSREKAA